MTAYRSVHLWIRIAPALVLAAAGCGTRSAAAPDPSPIAVRVVRPSRSDLESSLAYLGTVHSVREVQVTAQVQGTVRALPVPEGGSVRPGDTVAVLDAPDLEAVRDRSRADFDYWRASHEADLRLAGVQAISRQQLDAGTRTYLASEASLREAEARFARALERAPLRGTVLSRIAEVGQHVVPGQPLLLLGDARREVRAEVVQEDLDRGIAVGTPARVTVPGAGTVPSAVTEVSPSATGPARTFTVRLPLSTPCAARRGSSLKVDFIVASRTGSTSVPVEALGVRDATAGVFLVRGDRAIWQEVTPGIQQDSHMEVSFPWNGTDLVATSNLGSLQSGTHVYPVPVREVAP